jgi:hypothetical protein
MRRKFLLTLITAVCLVPAQAQEEATELHMMAVILHHSLGKFSIEEVMVRTVPNSLASKLESNSWQERAGAGETVYEYSLKTATGEVRRSGILAIPAAVRTIAFPDEQGRLRHDHATMESTTTLLRVPYDKTVASIDISPLAASSLPGPSVSKAMPAKKPSQNLDLRPFLSSANGG